MIIGYARVSTDGQTLDAQRATLAQAGAHQVFAEKISGAVTERKALARAIAALSAGDILLVTRLDRLPVQPVTCSMSSMLSLRLAQAFAHWPMLGRIPLPRMGD